MAGDWIKMRAALCTDPRVLRLAEIIGACPKAGRRLSADGAVVTLDQLVTRDVTRDITVASLLRVWGATNDHTRDGVWKYSTPATLDTAAGVPGFGEAMVQVGWAIYDAEARVVTLPNFLEYNAPSKGGARKKGGAADDERSAAAKRQAEYRARKKLQEGGNDLAAAVTGDVTHNGNGDATGDGNARPREEERREETGDRDSAGAPRPGMTPIGAVCIALKAAGVTPTSINPSHPMLATLVEAGATPEEFADAAKSVAGKADNAFAYILTVVANRRKKADELAPQLVRGALPPKPGPVNAQAAREQRNSQVADEWANEVPA